MSRLQIDVAVNAPEAGTIKEFLANEEDTVVVGQDLVRIETGGAKPAAAESKEIAPQDPPAKEVQEEKSPELKKETEATPSAPVKKETAAPKEKAPPAPKDAPATLGNREERRVCQSAVTLFFRVS